MTILEKVHSQDAMVLSIREEHWIRQGNTKYRGINRNRSWQLTKSCYLQFFLKNSFELYFQEDQPGYSWIFVIVYMYLTLIWVLQIPTSMCLDIEGLGSLSDDEISLNISKYITTLNSRLESTVGVSDANSTRKWPKVAESTVWVWHYQLPEILTRSSEIASEIFSVGFW